MVSKKVLLIFLIIVIAALIVANIYLKTKSTVTPSPQSEIPPAEASQLKSVDSPDGTQTLSMKTSKTGTETTYSFSVAGKEIFTKTVDPSISFSIPLNAFSPDNKYVLLKETGPAGESFFVLTASGDPSTQNEQTANITYLFAGKYPNLTIEDATGWGGIDLVVFNTVKGGGSVGPSFWFEMPSHTIIQLSTRF
jgi:hypothetical protein